MKWKLDRNVETGAGNVAYGTAGYGPPVVLAHGWPWSSFSWHRLIPALAGRFHVHWYDMPGYGQSEMRENQRTSLDVQGETFAFMLDHWKLERPQVIAHDFGGATTLRANLLHNVEFDRLVLMNIVAMRPWGSEFFDHVGKHATVFSGLPQHIHEAIVRAYIKGALANEIYPEDFEQLIAPWLTQEGRSSFYRQFAQADERYTAEIELMFGNVSCPKLILWGENDPWIPIERGRALHKRMPDARFRTMQNLGHLPQLESPQIVLEYLQPFLMG